MYSGVIWTYCTLSRNELQLTRKRKEGPECAYTCMHILKHGGCHVIKVWSEPANVLI